MNRTVMIIIAVVVVVAAALYVVFRGGGPGDDTIRIATEGAYPPFNMRNEQGELVGFDVDIARALCERMESECEIVAQDWDGIIPGLVADKYDAIIASMSITAERDEQVDFTNKYYTSHLRFVAEPGTDVSDAALADKTIGAQRGTIAAQYLEDTYGDQVEVKLYDTQEAAFLDLTNDRLDAILADVFPAYDWVQENEGYELVGPKLMPNDEIAVAVREGDDELRQRFNEAIAAIREDGTYQEINAKYFPFDIYE